MLKWLLRRVTETFERKWNYDASYLKELIEISPRAAWLFARRPRRERRATAGALRPADVRARRP